MKKLWVIIVCLMLLMLVVPVFAVTDGERQGAVSQFNSDGKAIKLAEDLFIVRAQYSEDGKTLTLNLLFTHESKDIDLEKFQDILVRNKRSICEAEDAKKIMDADLVVVWDFYSLDGLHLGTIEISKKSCLCKDI